MKVVRKYTEEDVLKIIEKDAAQYGKVVSSGACIENLYDWYDNKTTVFAGVNVTIEDG